MRINNLRHRGKRARGGLRNLDIDESGRGHRRCRRHEASRSHPDRDRRSEPRPLLATEGPGTRGDERFGGSQRVSRPPHPEPVPVRCPTWAPSPDRAHGFTSGRGIDLHGVRLGSGAVTPSATARIAFACSRRCTSKASSLVAVWSRRAKRFRWTSAPARCGPRVGSNSLDGSRLPRGGSAAPTEEVREQ
jgi:hypothetical protein